MKQHYLPIRSFTEFKAEYQLGKGAFSTVFAGYCRADSGTSCAIKCLSRPTKSINQFMKSIEVEAAYRLQGLPSVVQSMCVLHDARTGQTAIVQERMKCCLLQLIESRKRERSTKNLPSYIPLFSKNEIRSLARQLLQACNDIHSRGIIHRDIKPENILIESSGDILEDAPIAIKLSDFGSSRMITKNESSSLSKNRFRPEDFDIQNIRPFTSYVSTRWYRSPECLLSNGRYYCDVDVWAVGCVLYEAFTGKPLFPGKNEHDQIYKIAELSGADNCFHQYKQLHFNPSMGDAIYLNDAMRSHQRFPKFSCLSHFLSTVIADKEFIDFLDGLLVFHPERRSTVTEALSHRYLDQVDCNKIPYFPISVAPTAAPSTQNTSELEKQKESNWLSSGRALCDSTSPSPQIPKKELEEKQPDTLAALEEMMMLHQNGLDCFQTDASEQKKKKNCVKASSDNAIMMKLEEPSCSLLSSSSTSSSSKSQLLNITSDPLPATTTNATLTKSGNDTQNQPQDKQNIRNSLLISIPYNLLNSPYLVTHLKTIKKITNPTRGGQITTQNSINNNCKNKKKVFLNR